MPCLSQACLLGYTPSPQQAFQGDAAHQAQRRTWLTPNGSPGTWYTRRDYRSRGTLRPFHRTVFTAHTWSALPPFQVELPVRAHEARDGTRNRVHLGRRRSLETAPTRHGYSGIHIPYHENQVMSALRAIIA